MNRKTVVLLLSSSALVQESTSRSLIGIQQQLRQIDQNDESLLKLLNERPEEVSKALEQNLNDEIQQEQETKKKQKLAEKPIVKAKPEDDPENQTRFHRLGLIGTDNIAKASTDDMFAFSQVLASGGNINKAVKQLEVEEQEQKLEEVKKEEEKFQQQLQAMQEANKSPEEKFIKKKKAELHVMAVSELDKLANDDNTSAFAALVDSQKLEILAEQMQGSGTSVEEQRKIKKSEQEKEEKKKKKEEQQNKIKKKQALVQKKKEQKRKALERKKTIEEQLKKLTKEHGGLNGTEDTGYDDTNMDAYCGRDDPTAGILVQQGEDFEPEEFEQLLVEHRNHIISQKMTEGKHYIDQFV